MADKRKIKRLRKRLSVRFGIQSPDRVAFTEDISHHGLLIKTANVAPPGSTILVEVNLNETSSITLEARVMWAKKVPANMIRLVNKGGMGLRILKITEGEESFASLCNELSAR
jgi:Tfp pilus assembly protein PilZ